MEGGRRGLHLAAYARSAGKVKPGKDRLTPTQYAERKKTGGGVKVVVLLLGHKGVTRPDAWTALLDACPAVTLLVHTEAEAELPARFGPLRFPRSQVTVWEDITLFVLVCRMLKYALNAYRHATVVFYTCSGDGIPIVNGDTLEQPWAHVGLPERGRPSWASIPMTRKSPCLSGSPFGRKPWQGAVCRPCRRSAMVPNGSGLRVATPRRWWTLVRSTAWHR